MVDPPSISSAIPPSRHPAFSALPPEATRLAAAADFISTTTPSVAFAAAQPNTETRKHYSVETADIVAVGIVVLAIAAAFVAVVVALGFVFGKVGGADTLKIVGTCVGGSTISGIVAALVGRKTSGPKT